jgi:hypothetical protein
LERVKLMMKYDTSKTLNENKEIIFEQSEGCSPSLSDADIQTIVAEVYDALDKMTTIFFRAVYVEERAKIVYDNINKLVGKKYYDDISKECKTAKNEFIEQFKTRANQGGLIFSTNGNIIEVIDEALGEPGVENSVKAQKYLNAAKTTLTTKEVIPTPTPKKGDKPKPKKSGTGGYKACTGTYSMRCMTDPSGPIGKVQSCLDLVADGKYGPKTNAKLKELGYNSFKDSDVDTICKTNPQPQPVVDPDSVAIENNDDNANQV